MHDHPQLDWRASGSAARAEQGITQQASSTPAGRSRSEARQERTRWGRSAWFEPRALESPNQSACKCRGCMRTSRRGTNCRLSLIWPEALAPSTQTFGLDDPDLSDLCVCVDLCLERRGNHVSISPSGASIECSMRKSYAACETGCTVPLSSMFTHNCRVMTSHSARVNHRCRQAWKLCGWGLEATSTSGT